MANYSCFPLNQTYEIGGNQFSDNISGELRLGVGIGDDDFSVPGIIEGDISLDTLVGAYFAARLNSGGSVDPYVIAGFTRVEIELDVFGVSVSDSDNDISYGVGADFKVSSSASVNVEYINYFDIFFCSLPP